MTIECYCPECSARVSSPEPGTEVLCSHCGALITVPMEVVESKVKNWEITKNLLSEHTVHYQCSECETRLKSPLGDAGKTDSCPNCRASFTVPGDEHRKRIAEDQLRKRLNKKEEANKRKLERQQRKLERQQRGTEQAATTEQNNTMDVSVVEGTAEKPLEEKAEEKKEAVDEQQERAEKENVYDGHFSLHQYSGICVFIGAMGLVAAGIFGLLLIINEGQMAVSLGWSFEAMVQASLLWLVLSAFLIGFRHLLNKTDKNADTLDAILEELKKRNSD